MQQAPIGVIWIYLLASALVFIVIGTVIRLVVAVQRRQVEESRRFSQGLVEAQEAERARIARDLHDDVIQRIALIGGELSALGRTVESPSGAFRQRLDGLREELHDLADEVRGMARRAHPAILDHLGLVEALQSLAADMGISDDLTVTVDAASDVDMTGVTPAAALALFRVAQEGLRNVARHAGTKEATILLGDRAGGIFVSIQDRGVGINDGAKGGSGGGGGGGLGLRGLDERIRAVQGQLTVVRATGGGTTLTAWVPRAGGRS
jgi:signal transduction histidine kinase